HALAQVAPGERVLVRQGRYVEDVVDVDIAEGRADAPIVLTAWPDERPVLEGLLWLEDASHWAISGLTITWNDENDAGDHLVKLVGGSDCTFSDDGVRGRLALAALNIAGGEDAEPAEWEVPDNCIHDTVERIETNQGQ